MILTLQTHGHQTLEEVRRFLSGNEAVDFVLSDRVSALLLHRRDAGQVPLPRAAAARQGLHVPEFTKSRPRRSNDNALVESKNGNVIRRHFGYGQIPKPFAREVNAFARDRLSPFLNFHHPCLFASEVTDTKGKTRKRYRYQDVMTSFEKLRSLPEVEQYLKTGVTIAALEDQARAMSDLDAAVALKRARGSRAHPFCADERHTLGRRPGGRRGPADRRPPWNQPEPARVGLPPPGHPNGC